MKYCDKICSKRFSGTTSKQAFQEACKWYSTYFATNEDKFHDISVEFKSETNPENEELFYIRAIVYAMLDEKDITNATCTVCKEVHNLFFCNDKKDCNSCSVNAYKHRMFEKIGVKIEFYKEQIKRML